MTDTIGWTRIDNHVLQKLPEIGAVALAVYAIIRQHANRKGESYPAIERLAALVGMSTRQVKRAIAKLIDADVITRQRRSRGRGAGTYNVYTFPETPMGEIHEAAGGPMTGLPGDTDGPLKVTSGQIEHLHGAKSGTYMGPPVAQEQEQRTRTKNKKASLSEKLRFSDADKATAEWMFGLIRNLNPGHKEPSLNKWAEAIRLTRERDGRTDEEIRSLFEWANEDDFWKANILSPSKLRAKWDQLIIQKSRNGNGKSKHKTDSPARVRQRDYSHLG